MRIASTILAGSMVALAMLATPILAKDLKAQKTNEPSTSSTTSGSPPCHAYQQAPDGSWTPLPCEEAGPGGQTQHRSPARKADENTH
jgi:hypothetical protein